MHMPRTLLHLDDDRRQTDLLRLLLKNQDYTVISANDAATALELMRQQRPDIALVDINMPKTNGVEFAAQVKGMAEYRDIPLIALTANAMYGDREYYLANHFDGYLAKPMLRLELVRALEAALAKPVTPP
jgi:two-component system cell cycle response regulator DivK